MKPVGQREWHWTDLAACANSEVDMFCEYSTLYEAKQVCRGCDVRIDCLVWAIQHGEGDGVYGGLAPRERKGLTVTVVTGPDWDMEVPPVRNHRNRTSNKEGAS